MSLEIIKYFFWRNFRSLSLQYKIFSTKSTITKLNSNNEQKESKKLLKNYFISFNIHCCCCFCSCSMINDSSINIDSINCRRHLSVMSYIHDVSQEHSKWEWDFSSGTDCKKINWHGGEWNKKTWKIDDYRCQTSTVHSLHPPVLKWDECEKKEKWESM